MTAYPVTGLVGDPIGTKQKHFYSFAEQAFVDVPRPPKPEFYPPNVDDCQLCEF